MKSSAKLIIALLAIGSLMFGCRPEEIVEPGEKPEAALTSRPFPDCMTPVIVPLKDALGRTANPNGYPTSASVSSVYGAAEVRNDLDVNYIQISMGAQWLAVTARIFIGNCTNLATNFLRPDGSVATDLLPDGSTFPPSHHWAFVFNTSTLDLDENSCACYSIYIEAVQTDFDGNPCCLVGLWASPDVGDIPVGTDGHAFVACPVPCPLGESTACNDINPAEGRTCTDITINATSGSPNYDYYWFTSKPRRLFSSELIALGLHPASVRYDLTGAVASTLNSSSASDTYTACPPTNVNTYFYVVVADHSSIYSDLDSILVRSSANPCCTVPMPTPGDNLFQWDCTGSNGNPQVIICHIPPGNPENRMEMCISVDALSAHVVEYKSPPCTGHHSGCHIGPCDPCGPGSSDESIAAAAAYAANNNCPGN